MSGAAVRGVEPTFGGPARADLLPDEIHAQRRGRTVRTGIVGVVLLALLIVLGAFAGSVALSASAQSGLDEEQNVAQQLLVQQQKYIEVSHVQSQLGAITAGEQVASSADIDWPAYLNRLRAVLPGNAQVTAIAADGVTPVAGFTQSVAPLQGSQLASMVVTLSSPSIPDEASWIRSIATIPGVSGAVPSTATLTDGQYVLSITVALDASALSPRFPAKGAGQ